MRTSGSERLSPAAGYRLWAPSYAHETVVSALEERVVRTLLPGLGGRRLLDVGCGIGRRSEAAVGVLELAVGVDLVPEMLRAARAESPRTFVAGDVRRLPFASGSFDLVWCRLVLGHVESLSAPYEEMARVSSPGATLIVSDFHPRAVSAGHTRTFRDPSGVVHEIEHWTHDASAHETAAARSSWRVVTTLDAPAGEPERPFYERSGRLAQWENEADLPLVLAMSFTR